MGLVFGLAFISICSIIGGFFPYLYKNTINNKVIKFMIGFSAGVMLAASIWSLLMPGFEMANNTLFVVFGFLVGSFILIIVDVLSLYNIKTFKKVDKMYLAVTIHNVPEGLIVGMAFGIGVSIGKPWYGLGIAFAIGIQNLPESIALSISLYNKNHNKNKSLILSMISGLTEPIAGLIGFKLVVLFNNVLPSLLGFAAGCMIYVVLSEMISDAVGEDDLIGKIGIIFGFVIMMVLDIFL